MKTETIKGMMLNYTETDEMTPAQRAVMMVEVRYVMSSYGVDLLNWKAKHPKVKQ